MYQSRRIKSSRRRWLGGEALEPRAVFAVLEQSLFPNPNDVGGPSAGDQFGGAVAITSEWTVVGARFDDDAFSNSGSVSIFDAETGALMRTIANPHPAVDDYFGTAVALDGDLLAVSAPTFNGPGSVYLFDAASGALLRELQNPAPVNRGHFGSSLAVSHGAVAVGAQNTTFGVSGSAYLFDVATGQLRHSFAGDSEAWDWFGYSVALDAEHMVVGTPLGAIAYVFDTETGAEVTRFTGNPSPEIVYAERVAIEGDTVAVGSYGGVWLYSLSQQTVRALGGGGTGSRFGVGLAMVGDDLLVGARSDTDGGITSGKAYLYSASTGILRETFQNPTPSAGDQFGTAVALGGGRLVIGATTADDQNVDQGAAYVFSDLPSSFDPNRAPTLDMITSPAPLPINASEQTINLTGISAGLNEQQNLSVFAYSSHPGLIQNPTVHYSSPSSTGSLTFTPVAGLTGSAQITVVVVDDGGVIGGGRDRTTRIFTVTVSPPTPTVAVDDAFPAIDEDVGFFIPYEALLANDTTAVGPLTVIEIDQTVGGVTNPLLTGVAFTPMNNYFGPGGFRYTILDGANQTTSARVTFNVLSVNDPPRFSGGASQIVAEDAGLVRVPNWIYNISPGPADEAAQTVALLLTAENPALFAVQPAVDMATGDLTFRTAPNAVGYTIVNLDFTDSAGGRLRELTVIELTAVNDPPSFTAGQNLAVGVQAGLQSATWATAISAGPGETDQTVTFQVSTDHPELFVTAPVIDAGGRLTFTPAGATGTANVTVKLRDSEGSESAARTFTITFLPEEPAVGGVPTSQTVREDGSTGTLGFQISDHQTAANSLTVTAVSNNQLLVPNGNITLGGSGTQRTISVVPAPGRFHESAEITVTITDPNGHATSFAFTISVALKTPGDINNDASVDPQDIAWSIYYFNVYNPGAIGNLPAGQAQRSDVNHDGLFDAADILLTISVYNAQAASGEGESPNLGADEGFTTPFDEPFEAAALWWEVVTPRRKANSRDSS